MEFNAAGKTFLRVDRDPFHYSTSMFSRFDLFPDEEVNKTPDADEEKVLMEILQLKKRKKKFTASKAPKQKKDNQTFAKNLEAQKGHWTAL